MKSIRSSMLFKDVILGHRRSGRVCRFSPCAGGQWDITLARETHWGAVFCLPE